MINVIKEEITVLKTITPEDGINSIFKTYEWMLFLKKNQNAAPVILKLEDKEGRVLGYFVGLIIKKFGLKILGSPFEGWLTPDMGFIRIKSFNINDAIEAIVRYAFQILKCVYVQIIDKDVIGDNLKEKYRKLTIPLLKINIDKPLENILLNFTSNGRRDVRSSIRKGNSIERVPFDQKFADIYYDQLIEVFARQNLLPNYPRKKIYALVEAFANHPENVLALIAKAPNGMIAATNFSFGFSEWAYYVGAASYREFQKNLPNEALFWSFVQHWHESGVKNLDLMGYRTYKMKYNPEIVNTPIIIIEKIPGLLVAKNIARNTIEFSRKIGRKQ